MAPPERGTVFVLLVYERLGTFAILVYLRVAEMHLQPKEVAALSKYKKTKFIEILAKITTQKYRRKL